MRKTKKGFKKRLVKGIKIFQKKKKALKNITKKVLEKDETCQCEREHDKIFSEMKNKDSLNTKKSLYNAKK